MKMTSITGTALPARYFRLIDDYLRSAGTSPDEVLRATGIDPERFKETDFAITPQQYERLLAHVLRVTGRSDIGFEWGRRVKLNSHGLLGYAMLSYATLDQGLRQCARYYSLLTPLFRMIYQRRGNDAEIILRPVQPMGKLLLEVSLEILAVSTYLQCKPPLLGPDCACDIHLSIPPPPHACRYRELAPACVHFDASPVPEVRLVLGNWNLDAPLPMANEHAVRTAEELCDALLQARGEPGNWTAWVVMMLDQARNSRPTLAALARLRGLSPRTLDRHLRNEGSSFRDLAIDVRNARARRLLADGGLPVSEIAYRLGFTDVANFSRAFRKANGVSPSDFRDGGEPGTAARR
ncbi:MAG: AraC family transcriptional regulator ligand-binding domain-containing protein [Burkholderiaceae bacterium]